MVEWLLSEGVDIDGWNDSQESALYCAVCRGNYRLVEFLLERGADPNLRTWFNSILEMATDARTARLLLQYGADPADITGDVRRLLLAFGEPDAKHLHRVSRNQYLAGRDPSETRNNPEETTGPYRVAMIRSGVNGYNARRYFKDLENDSPRLAGKAPTWCADRFGQSFTLLEDGRIILIAGEHEDAYDPDFCIYNDVIVVSPEGEIRIFGYPYSVFPPTDFHTATVVGRDIYVIGSLGYIHQRDGTLPIFRLSTVDYRIEPVVTTGEMPGRLFHHRADLIKEHKIQVRGGKRLTFPDGKEQIEKNGGTFRLDLRTRVWTRVP